MTKNCRPRDKDMRQRAFVLVLTLFLTVLLASSGAAIAVSATTESVLAASAANDLQHELAIDSFLAVLPRLQDRATKNATPSLPDDDEALTSIAYGDIRVTARVHPNASRLRMTGADYRQADLTKLKLLAREHGLPAESIKPRPIMDEAVRKQVGSFLWYDQLVTPTEFEEVFSWRLASRTQPAAQRHKTWSDLIGFWGNDAVYLELETSIGGNTRRWFVVVLRETNALRVLIREPI